MSSASEYDPQHPGDPETGPWKTDQAWMSPYNWMPENRGPAAARGSVELYDTTLRDGEQAAGAMFSVDDKVEIARALDASGVTFIEAGFPTVSHADREAVAAVADDGRKARITCLSRARREDLDLAAECGVWGTTIEVPVGFPRLRYQFGWDAATVADKAADGVSYADSLGVNPSLFLIDSTRAELATLELVIKSAYDTGSLRRLVIVDTLGVAVPATIGYLVRRAREWAPGVALEVHTHNDFGLGVATAFAGVEAGAQCIQATVNGLGQRAGNAALEEIGLAATLLYGMDTGLDLSRLQHLTDLVAERSGYAVADNKPITGSRLFAWEPGIPVAALRRNPLTVEPFHPDLVGGKHEIVLGKQSGRASIEWALEEVGVEGLTDTQIDALLADVKQRAIDQSSAINWDDFRKMIETVRAG